MTCGIYAITAPSGRRYVGQSRTIELRMEDHKRRLMRGTHHCVALQHDWNSYRPNMLHLWSWNVLMRFSINAEQESLDEFERYFITYSSKGAYNVVGAKEPENDNDYSP